MENPLIRIRPELPADLSAIHQVHVAAFPTAAEANLVNRLRVAGKSLVSLIAEHQGQIVGHILFSPVTISGMDKTWTGGAGLAPLAVLPGFQKKGIGSRLAIAGIEACRKVGIPYLVVLGEPEFYGRFGFRRADERGLDNEYGAAEAFQVLELSPKTLPPKGGMVQYAAEFAELGSS